MIISIHYLTAVSQTYLTAELFRPNQNQNQHVRVEKWTLRTQFSGVYIKHFARFVLIQFFFRSSDRTGWICAIFFRRDFLFRFFIFILFFRDSRILTKRVQSGRSINHYWSRPVVVIHHTVVKRVSRIWVGVKQKRIQ